MGKNVAEFLKENNIPFEEIKHNEVFTMEDMAREGLYNKCTPCKNLFLRDAKGKRHFIVTALDSSFIDLKLLGEKIGTKLSFASEGRVKKYLGSFSGCVSPFGIINDEEHSVTVILDEGLKGKYNLGLHPNENTSTFVISQTALVEFIKLMGNDWEYHKF